MVALIVAVVLVLFALFVASRTVRIIPQARAGVVERLGRYSRTLSPGMTIVVPFVDRVRPLLDLREQVVTFPPQPVITADNVSVQIDTVLYFTITEPRSATYEVANPLQAIEQLTVTTLRNIIGSLTLEETLTSRDAVNDQLRIVLDERTGKWGIRINGVELKSIDPPGTIQEAMEKQMRAERDRRAAILNAEGVKQSQILTAEGEKQSAVLRAEGSKQAAILRSEGEAKAIDTVFRAIHEGNPDPKLLSYQYLQMLPQLARGEANKIWVIPSEFTQALSNLGGLIPERDARPQENTPLPLAPPAQAPPDNASSPAAAQADDAAVPLAPAEARAGGDTSPASPPVAPADAAARDDAVPDSPLVDPADAPVPDDVAPGSPAADPADAPVPDDVAPGSPAADPTHAPVSDDAPAGSPPVDPGSQRPRDDPSTASPPVHPADTGP